MEKFCYCDSGRAFAVCCEPLLLGRQTAETAQELMRSRYSAYATVATGYLLKTTHPSVRKNYSAQNIEDWARSSAWQKLEILSRTRGGKEDARGEVEFKAFYKDPKGTIIVHHELSEFVREGDQWYYLKGIINPTSKNTVAKTQRNDPCPCGSGLKFKKCCG